MFLYKNVDFVCDMVNNENIEIISSDSDSEEVIISTLDLDSLEGTNWITDNVVTEYINLLKIVYHERIFCFSSHFFEHFSSGGIDVVRRWTKNENIFKKKLVFYPIIQNSHWFLAVQNNENQTLTMYDPFTDVKELLCINEEKVSKKETPKTFKLVQQHNERLNNILYGYLCQHVDKPNELNFTVSVKIPPEIPHQRNGHDCGVYMLQFMKYIAMDKIINFTNEDMSFLRNDMRTEIISKTLRPTLQ